MSILREVRMLNLTCSISLIFCLSSCAYVSVGSRDNVASGPYVLMVYPTTSRSGLGGLNEDFSASCAMAGCGELLLVGDGGKSSLIDVRGMVEERASFSSDGTKAAFTDRDGIVVVDNGILNKIEIQEKSPVVRYLSINDNLDIVYVNHQPATDEHSRFDSIVYSRKDGDGITSREHVNGVPHVCSDRIYLFSNGEIDHENMIQYYPEYIYEGKSRFYELRKSETTSRDILGFTCDGSDSFEYIALVDGDIVLGKYNINSGFVDGVNKYSWDEYSSTGDADPIIADIESVWGLNSLGEMRVFDRKSPTYRIAWDMYPYFEKVSVSDIAAKSIQRDGSAFFFGIPKGKDKGWVMMEVDLKSGEILRSVHLPILDEHYPDGEVQDIYMGDVDGFRKWADTQPKFDYTAMH